jgi:hypothetical protein
MLRQVLWQDTGITNLCVDFVAACSSEPEA